MLAPFRSFINIGVIPNYVEELKKLDQFKDYDLDQLESAINESINWGLLTPINQDSPKYLIVQPIFPYFLQAKLRQTKEKMREDIQKGFKTYYQNLAIFLYYLLISKNFQERQMGKIFVQREYENLYQSLQICLKKQEKVIFIWMCLYNYLALSKNKVTRLRLAQNVCDNLKVYELEKRDIYQEDIIDIFTSLGNCYLDNKDYDNSKNTYQSVLNVILEIENFKPIKKQKYIAIIYYQFARVFYELKEYKKAKKYYQQVLDLFSDKSSRENNSILRRW